MRKIKINLIDGSFRVLPEYSLEQAIQLIKLNKYISVVRMKNPYEEYENLKPSYKVDGYVNTDHIVGIEEWI